MNIGTKHMDRFWNRVDRSSGPDACWPWTGPRTVAGYGYFTIGNSRHRGAWVRFYAHRFSWQLAHDEPVPSNREVCHSCDNPPCCNPAHLWVGTKADNMRDSLAKGRHRGGDKPKPTCRLGHLLTPDNIRTIPGKRTGTRRGGCLICARNSARKYRAANRERLLKQMRDYYYRRKAEQALKHQSA